MIICSTMASHRPIMMGSDRPLRSNEEQSYDWLTNGLLASHRASFVSSRSFVDRQLPLPNVAEIHESGSLNSIETSSSSLRTIGFSLDTIIPLDEVTPNGHVFATLQQLDVLQVMDLNEKSGTMIVSLVPHAFGKSLSKDKYMLEDLHRIDKVCRFITKSWSQNLQAFCSTVPLIGERNSREFDFRKNGGFSGLLKEYLALLPHRPCIPINGAQHSGSRERRSNYGDIYKDYVAKHRADDISRLEPNSKAMLSAGFVQWVEKCLADNPKTNCSKFRSTFDLFHGLGFNPEAVVQFLLKGQNCPSISEHCKHYLAVANLMDMPVGVRLLKKKVLDCKHSRKGDLVEISSKDPSSWGNSSSVCLTNGRVVARPRVNAGKFDQVEHGYFFYWGTLSFFHLLASIRRKPGMTIPDKLVQFVTARVISLFTHLRVIRQIVVKNLTINILNYWLTRSGDKEKPYFIVKFLDSKRREIFFRAFPIFFARVIRHYIDNVRPITEPDNDILFVHYHGGVIDNYSGFLKNHYKLDEYDPYVRHSMRRKGNATANSLGKSLAQVDTHLTAEHSERTAAQFYVAEHEAHAALRLRHELTGELRAFQAEGRGIPGWWTALMYPVLIALDADDYDYRKVDKCKRKKKMRKLLEIGGVANIVR